MYNFLLKIVGFYYRIFFGAKFYGVKNIPLTGGVLFCVNHLSNNDPVIVATHIPRKLGFMAKKELFKVPIISSIVKWAGAFPIDRSTSDLRAVKAALTVLKNGSPLMIFPEGRRNKEFLPGKIKPGAAVIAAKAGVPVLPVYIKGKYKLFGKTEVYFGKPISAEVVKEVVGKATLDTENKNKIISQQLYDWIIGAEESGKLA